MAVTTYAELQARLASLLHRDDLTSEIQEAIALCEAELQTKCKLLEFETSASITITSGTGTLPTGLLAIRSLYWDDDQDSPLDYIEPSRFDALRNDEGRPGYYTVTGSSLKVIPSDSGTAVATYSARFTALSTTNTSNSLLTDFPDAYVYGALKHVAVYADDDAMLQRAGTMFAAACERINVNNEQRKFGGPLAVRTR